MKDQSYPLDEAGSATLKKWGDIDKIAAEAWDKIRDLTSAGNGKTSDFVAIIKSACEKAIAAQPDGMLSGGVQQMDANPAAATVRKRCPKCGYKGDPKKSETSNWGGPIDYGF